MKDSAANTKNENASMIRYIELSHPEFEYEAIFYYRLRPAANSSGACSNRFKGVPMAPAVRTLH